MQIYQASQLYDVIASLYFPLNPGIYNGTVPGGQNSLTIQNASFWQFQYQDPVNGTITIPPYTTVAFTVNPGQAYTITPQWALVDIAVTGVLVLPYGWVPTDVSVSGNYSPIALAPSVTNTWPYVQSPVTVAGEFGPNANDVEVQMRPPQQIVALSIAGSAVIVAGVAGESIRLRKMSWQGYVTPTAANFGAFGAWDGAVLTPYISWNEIINSVHFFDFDGFALPIGQSFYYQDQGGAADINGVLTYDKF